MTSSRQSWESTSARQAGPSKREVRPSRPICGFTLHGGSVSHDIRVYLPVSRHIPPYPAISRRGYREKNRPHTRDCQWPEGAHTSMIKFKRPTRAPDPALTSRSPLRRYLSLPRATPLAARLPRGPWCLELGLSMWVGGTLQCRVPFVLVKVWYLPLSFDSPGEWYGM